MKTKRTFAQEIMNALQNNRLNIDFKIVEREVFLVMDEVVNAMATESFFENWKFSRADLDEHYITTWDGDNAISVVDQEDGKPSYLVLPASYVDLPDHRGIDEIWPQNYGDGFQSVVISTHRKRRQYQNNKVFNMQGRLVGNPKGQIFEFWQADVAKNFSEKMGVRLAIRDSSAISITDPYPIPANKERQMIEKCVEVFMNKRAQPTDKIRDQQDQP